MRYQVQIKAPHGNLFSLYVDADTPGEASRTARQQVAETSTVSRVTAVPDLVKTRARRRQIAARD